MPLEENLRRLAQGTLAFMPGTAWQYGMSIDVLGGVIGADQGNISDLEGAVAKYVHGAARHDRHAFLRDRQERAWPTPMATASPSRSAWPNRRAVETRPARVEHLSPRRIFQADAPQSGGSGMAGTAGDFMKLLEAVARRLPQARNAGRGARQPDRGARTATDPGQRFGFLGARDRRRRPHPAGTCAGLIQWGGIWGNNWILDPDEQHDPRGLHQHHVRGLQRPLPRSNARRRLTAEVAARYPTR